MNREHPTCTERKPLTQECGWKGGDRGGLAEREKERRTHGKSKTLLTGGGLLMEGTQSIWPPEATEIRSALPASKSIQSQIAAVSSVRSLLRPHRFAELAAVGCGSPK